MNDSHVDIHEGGITFAGKDAITLFKAITLASALKLYSKCGVVPTRGMTITKMLVMAEPYTGKKYKRGQAKLAHEDMRIWIEVCKSAMPTTLEGEN